MTPESTLRALASLVEGMPPCEDGVLYEALLQGGCEAQTARDAIQLAPIAFGRAMMHGLEVQFSEVYLRCASDGEILETGRLDEHPCFRAAHALLTPAPSKALFQALALRSSEVHSVNELLKKGSDPRDLKLAPVAMFSSPPTVEGLDKVRAHLSACLARPNPPARPWWQFW